MNNDGASNSTPIDRIPCTYVEAEAHMKLLFVLI